MLLFIIQGSHSEFPTMVLSLSYQGCSPVRSVLAEVSNRSLLLKGQDPGGDALATALIKVIFPHVQSRALLLVSAYILTSSSGTVSDFLE